MNTSSCSLQKVLCFNRLSWFTRGLWRFLKTLNRSKSVFQISMSAHGPPCTLSDHFCHQNEPNFKHIEIDSRNPLGLRKGNYILACSCPQQFNYVAHLLSASTFLRFSLLLIPLYSSHRFEHALRQALRHAHTYTQSHTQTHT